MKIQCDICNAAEVSVFCSADEAALCDACDRRVHLANKLAGKHQRFSLLRPPSHQLPLCDICRERRALLFCRQDRAILCRDCDVSIHNSNEHASNHDRFLLTGIQLSPATSSSSAASLTGARNGVVPLQIHISDSPSSQVFPVTAPLDKNNRRDRDNQLVEEGNGVSVTSSITEYLLDMLPGWQVEDFLDSSFGFFKEAGNEGSQVGDSDRKSSTSCVSSENTSDWVPRISAPESSLGLADGGGQIDFRQ